MSVMHGYFIEPSRQARLLNRQKLKEALPQYDVPEGRVQAEIPGAWLRDPIAPEERRVFHVSMREAFCELDYTVNVLMIVNKSPRITMHSNLSDDQQREESERRKESFDRSRPQESHDEEDAEAKRWKAIVDSSDVPGLDKGHSSTVKFFVFLQAEIGEEILVNFLKAVPDGSGSDTYDYVFLHVSNDVGGEAKAKGKDNVDSSSGSSTDAVDRARFVLKGEPFSKDMSGQQINELWLDLINQYCEIRSLFGMHAYLVLDEQTADDGDTALLVTETDGVRRSRRIDFVALKEGMVLKSIEALKMDIDQMPGDWTGVIRGPVMKVAEELWQRELDSEPGHDVEEDKQVGKEDS